MLSTSHFIVLLQHLRLSPLQLPSILLPLRPAPIPLPLQLTTILLLLRPSLIPLPLRPSLIPLHLRPSLIPLHLRSSLIPLLLSTPVAMSSHSFQYRVLTRFFVAFYHASIALNQIRINPRTFSSTQANIPPLFMNLLVFKFLQCQAIRCASL